jgi:DNA-binding NarL/FixJ family response regulator
MNKETITALVADDHVLVRNIVCRLLQRAGDIQVVATASNGEEAVRQAVRYRPHLALLAIAMPIMNGIKATRQIRQQCPDTRVLIVSGYDSGDYVRRAIEAGASGYVLKEVAGSDVVAAVRSLYRGDRYFSKPVAEVAGRFL